MLEVKEAKIVELQDVIKVMQRQKSSFVVREEDDGDVIEPAQSRSDINEELAQAKQMITLLQTELKESAKKLELSEEQQRNFLEQTRLSEEKLAILAASQREEQKF